MSTRRFPGQRAVRIAFRTAHLGAIALLIGAATFDQPTETWLSLTVLSGSALVAGDVYKDPDSYFRYLQSWAILTKLGLLVAAAIWPGFLVTALWTALVIGSVISHAPGRVRQYALWGDPGPCAHPRAPASAQSSVAVGGSSGPQ